MATFDAHKNFSFSLVATAPAPADSGTTLTVTPGTGALFPAAPFNVVVFPPLVQPSATNAEIIRVTSKGTGDNWTILRGQEGSVVQVIAVGDTVSLAVTAKLLTDIEAAFSEKLAANAPITPATKTKLTYNEFGLITVGTDATTADIADSTNRRYVTDAEQTVLTQTSGVNSGDQTIDGLLPSQTANSGKFLTTDGSNPAWGTPGTQGQVPPTTSQTALGYRGVNLSGNEFAGSFQGSSQPTYTYFGKKGSNAIRLPFAWEELQPTLNSTLDTSALTFIQNEVGWAKAAGMQVILDMHNYGRRYVYNNGGLTDDFSAANEKTLLVPYADFSPSTSEVTLRDYGRGLFGTAANPASPATSYLFAASFKVVSVSSGADEIVFEAMRIDDNNRYTVSFNPTNATWFVRKIVGGVSTDLATGTLTITIGTYYTLVIDVGQTTAGKLNVSIGGTPLFTTNSVSTDAALAHGYVAIMPNGTHTTIKSLTLNVAGDTTSGGQVQYRVTDSQLPMSAWNDFWTRLSTVFKDESAVLGYDHNEPYSMAIPTSTTNYSQAVATANSVALSTVTNMYQNMLNSIRANGDNKYIFVGWDSFSNLHHFVDFFGSNPDPWIIDTLSPGKVVYAPHYYFDTDHSGTYATNTLPGNTTVFNESTPFFIWAKNKGVPAAILEYGIPDNSVWYSTLDYFLTLMDQYSVWGTYWAGGDIYSSITTIQPTSSYTVDKGQMPTLMAHLAASSPVTISDLRNVNITSPADNDLLAYDSATTTWTNQNAAAAAVASAVHTHAASDVVSGTVATARLGSGTASSTTFLRGDQTWATPAGGGGGGVTTPGTTTNTALALWNGTTGAALLNSLITVDGSNNLSTLTDSAFFFKTSASDVLIKYAGVGTDALLIQNVNAGSGKIKISYTNSIVFDLYGTGTAATLDSQGSLGIGISPTAKLTLKAGTATANTAPLKLTSGTNLTTPEDGAVEYNGTHLYATIGSTRYQLDQQSVGGSGITRTITSVSTATTAGGTAATDYVYLVSGTTTLTLPTAVGNTNRYTVKNTGSATVTVATTSSQTIDGSTTASLPVQYTSIDLISNGTNWSVL